MTDSELEAQVISNASVEEILVIEDHPVTRSFIRQSLQDRFNILLAKNGDEGIKSAIEGVPDLIITDLMMPNKNGFEVAEVIRNDTWTSHIPILMLTARADIESRKRTWKSDIDEYIGKPFNADELLIRCEDLLSIRRILSKLISGDSGSTDLIDIDQKAIGSLNPKEQEFMKSPRQ